MSIPLLRRIALVALIIGLAISGCAVVWFSVLSEQASERAAAKARIEIRANQLDEAATQQIDATLRSVDTALQYLRVEYLREPLEFDRAVHDLLATFPEGMLEVVVVFDADGYLAYSSHGPAKRIYFGDREHFKVHADSGADRLFISKPVTGRLNPIPLIPLSRPIFDGKRFRGVISIPLRPEYLSEKFRDLRVAPDDLLAIVRADGKFIARNHHLEQALTTTLPPSRPFLVAKPGERGTFSDISTVDGIPELFSWRRLSEWPLSVVVAVNEQAELKPLDDGHVMERQRALAGMLIFFVGVLAVSFLLWRISNRNTALLLSEQRFRTLIDDNNAIILQVDPASGRILDANNSAVKFYGWPRRELLAKSVQDINALSPERVAEERAAVMRNERNYFVFPHRIASGETKIVEVYSTPLTSGDTPMLVSIIHDITERKAAERIAERERTRLDTLLRTASDGIHILDAEGLLVEANAAFLNMLDYDGSVIGRLKITEWDAAMSWIEIRT